MNNNNLKSVTLENKVIEQSNEENSLKILKKEQA